MVFQFLNIDLLILIPNLKVHSNEKVKTFESEKR